MNEHLPYEDDLLKRLNDLPLPSEDIAWEDMRRRLEKDDDEGPIILPTFKGCGGRALLLLFFVIAFLFIADPGKWFHGKIKNVPVETATAGRQKQANMEEANSDRKRSVNKPNDKIPLNNDTALIKKSITHATIAGDSFEIKKLLNRKPSLTGKNNMRKESRRIKRMPIKKNHPFKEKSNTIIPGNNYKYKPVTKKTGGRMNSKVSGNAEADSIISVPLNLIQLEEKPPAKATDSIVSAIAEAMPGPGSNKKKLVDTTAASNGKAAPGSSINRRIYFSAGLGIHRLLPVAGQKTNPYNSVGRRSSLGDYIPSVYLRMYKEKKWFLQSEFRYGAPQYTKEIVFSQKKIIDTFSASAITTSNSIKKTFYHQLPLSFNYFVLPGLSIGAGVTFNKFRSALVQQEVHKTGIVTPTDSLLSTGLINQKKADSNFVTTYLQALIETQYQWKRLSAGVRYSFGLQPYLKFKLPGGEERREKNSSLQLFIRYELWRSLKK